MSTGSRLLQLIDLFQHHRRWTGPELADRLGVSPRTLRRDVDRLRQLGYVIESDPGTDGGYRLAVSTRLPPLSITPDEAIALAVGLHASAHSASTAVAESSVSALAKVVAMLPPELRRRADAVGQATSGLTPTGWGAEPTPAPDVLGTLAEGCRDMVRASFAYVDAEDRSSERYVEPYRLVTVGRRWYLFAHDLDRADWRTFRVDRITVPALTRSPFTPRPLPADDLAAYVAERLRTFTATEVVRARVRLPLDAVRAASGVWIDAEPDGEWTWLTMPTDDPRWVAVLLTSFDADVEVVEPAGYVDQLRRIGERLTRLTATSG